MSFVEPMSLERRGGFFSGLPFNLHGIGSNERDVLIKERGYLASVVETVNLQNQDGHHITDYVLGEVKLGETRIRPIQVSRIDLTSFGLNFPQPPKIEELAKSLQQVTTRNDRVDGETKIWDEPPPSDVYIFTTTANGQEKNYYSSPRTS